LAYGKSTTPDFGFLVGQRGRGYSWGNNWVNPARKNQTILWTSRVVGSANRGIWSPFEGETPKAGRSVANGGGPGALQPGDMETGGRRRGTGDLRATTPPGQFFRCLGSCLATNRVKRLGRHSFVPTGIFPFVHGSLFSPRGGRAAWFPKPGNVRVRGRSTVGTSSRPRLWAVLPANGANNRFAPRSGGYEGAAPDPHAKTRWAQLYPGGRWGPPFFPISAPGQFPNLSAGGPPLLPKKKRPQFAEKFPGSFVGHHQNQGALWPPQ